MGVGCAKSFQNYTKKSEPVIHLENISLGHLSNCEFFSQPTKFSLILTTLDIITRVYKSNRHAGVQLHKNYEAAQFFFNANLQKIPFISVSTHFNPYCMVILAHFDAQNFLTRKIFLHKINHF